ncbi:hypothetical protein [Humisphaera borealis]|uniref:Uncharacterized protein n=1 Tax=Humisphaera borealis TaxID=2807512 RepID=A0A7M2WPU0_9BACT|nr:hypothetical protein [Humisphaera borealis]QOV87433.1 hypothetical protein IPV69_14150 [Humisphaera borealis]
MTALPSPILISEPNPALTLTYANAATREKLPPMIRIGGVIAFIGLCLTGLMLPVWKYPDHCGNYKPVVSTLVPAMQLLCVGSGMTLIICGRLFAGRKPRAWYWFPILLHVFLLAIAIRSVATMASYAENDYPMRWRGMSSIVL